MDKKQIEKEAKQILDKFASALSKVKTKDEDFFVERDESEREEGVAGKGSKDPLGHVREEGFKSKLLWNAPNKDEDFVIAEKGGWKK